MIVLYRLFSLSVMTICAALASAQIALIPQPRSIEVVAGSMVSPRQTIFVDTKAEADSLLEAYQIEITPEQIIVESHSPQGRIWAQRTLDQLRRADGSYPQVKIEDCPEFPLRGFMYDSGRNFIEVGQIEEFIELCSQYKLNVFHWHLTDKPAWRIENRAYPQLNDPRYQRIGRDEGRYYTYDDLHHVASFARERGVMVIPEIDMPGHSDYFNAAFGTAMNTKEGMAILETCLKEFFDEFPAEEMPYIHIGSDEIHIDNPDEFMRWAISVVEGAGRTPIVWDPGLQAGNGAIYQIWRDGSANADEIPEGKRVIDSFMGYLNYVDPMIFTNRMFLHRPGTTGKHDRNNLGGILCLWNDVRVIDNAKIPVHNGMMGGVLPFAERFWTGDGCFDSNSDVLRHADTNDMKRLDEFHAKMLYHKERYLPEQLAYWSPNSPRTQWQIEVADSAGSVLHTGSAYGDVIDFDAYCSEQGISDAASATITRSISMPSDTTIYCRIGFDAPARSNRISDGIAQQGKWENYGRVVVNGEDVLPPVWTEPGLYRYHYNTWARPEEELAYTDEQLYWTRKPVALHLRKGDNIITLSTRKHFTGQRFQAALLVE